MFFLLHLKKSYVSCHIVFFDRACCVRFGNLWLVFFFVSCCKNSTHTNLCLGLPWMMSFSFFYPRRVIFIINIFQGWTRIRSRVYVSHKVYKKFEIENWKHAISNFSIWARPSKMHNSLKNNIIRKLQIGAN